MSKGSPIATEWIDTIRRRVLSGEGMIYIAFVILIIVFSVSSPYFLTLSNFENIGRQDSAGLDHRGRHDLRHRLRRI